MKMWMKKAFVSIIAILTLGTYAPTYLLEVDAENNKNNGVTAKSDDHQAQHGLVTEIVTEEVDIEPDYMHLLQAQAKAQSLIKFGPKIAEKVEDEFTAVILPQMEKVIAQVTAENGEEAARFFAITEDPAPGYGERIFNVADNRTGEELIQFHVRRDNRPLDGYYFNFHYHLSKDNFKEHYTLGEIYWDKNTPPKWMA